MLKADLEYRTVSDQLSAAIDRRLSGMEEEMHRLRVENAQLRGERDRLLDANRRLSQSMQQAADDAAFTHWFCTDRTKRPCPIRAENGVSYQSIKEG